MNRQYVVSTITHTEFFSPSAMSWQRRGNVIGCHHVASKISASVNGALDTPKLVSADNKPTWYEELL